MLYGRNLLNNIKKWYENDQILLLNGARQVGKTSILMKIKEEFEAEQRQVIYLNLEDISILKELNEHPLNLLKYIGDKNTKAYCLLDEIQYLDNPSNFLKLLYDAHKGKIKIIATGSSALELKAKLQDSLAGRKITFSVSPLCFEEFLEFRQSPLKKYFNTEPRPDPIQNEFIALLNEYLIYGGMPAVVLETDADKKQILLQDYINAYINKDIRYIGKIDSIADFNRLIVLLASQIGNLMNMSEITNTLGIKRKELKYYLDLLQHTFVFDILNPFSTNVRSQISKMPKGYFFDLGVRNQILGNMLMPDSRTDAGALFENFIYLELKQKIRQDQLYFYRTTTGGEIDFIIRREDTIAPIEVKYRRLNRLSPSRTVAALGQHVKINKAYRVNLNFNSIAGKPRDIDFISFLNIQL